MVALLAAVVASLVVVAPRTMRIEGHSMSPSLHHGDRAVFRRPLGPLARGDVVAYRYPRNPARMFIGRIVGLPGERLAIVGGVVHVGGVPLDEPYLAAAARSAEHIAEVRLGGDEYYVLGDNRRNSSDSRQWGPVAARFVQKRLAYVWWRTARGGATPPATGRPSR